MELAGASSEVLSAQAAIWERHSPLCWALTYALTVLTRLTAPPTAARLL